MGGGGGVVGDEGVPTSRGRHVDVAVEAEAHRALQAVCGDGGTDGDEDRASLFAAEAAAHPPHPRDNFGGGEAADTGAHHLSLGDGLRQRERRGGGGGGGGGEGGVGGEEAGMEGEEFGRRSGGDQGEIRGRCSLRGGEDIERSALHRSGEGRVALEVEMLLIIGEGGGGGG